MYRMTITALLFSLVVGLTSISSAQAQNTGSLIVHEDGTHYVAGSVVCNDPGHFATVIVKAGTPEGAEEAQEQLKQGNCVTLNQVAVLQVFDDYTAELRLPKNHLGMNEGATQVLFWRVKMQPEFTGETWYMFTTHAIEESI